MGDKQSFVPAKKQKKKQHNFRLELFKLEEPDLEVRHFDSHRPPRSKHVYSR